MDTGPVDPDMCSPGPASLPGALGGLPPGFGPAGHDATGGVVSSHSLVTSTDVVAPLTSTIAVRVSVPSDADSIGTVQVKVTSPRASVVQSAGSQVPAVPALGPSLTSKSTGQPASWPAGPVTVAVTVWLLSRPNSFVASGGVTSKANTLIVMHSVTESTASGSDDQVGDDVTKCLEG